MVDALVNLAFLVAGWIAKSLHAPWKKYFDERRAVHTVLRQYQQQILTHSSPASLRESASKDLRSAVALLEAAYASLPAKGSRMARKLVPSAPDFEKVCAKLCGLAELVRTDSQPPEGSVLQTRLDIANWAMEQLGMPRVIDLDDSRKLGNRLLPDS